MWMTNFLGIELILNDRRRPQAAGAPTTRIFVRYWWIHSKSARRRLNERYPMAPLGSGRL